MAHPVTKRSVCAPPLPFSLILNKTTISLVSVSFLRPSVCKVEMGVGDFSFDLALDMQSVMHPCPKRVSKQLEPSKRLIIVDLPARD